MDSVEQVMKGLTKAQDWALRYGDSENIAGSTTPACRCKLQGMGIVRNRQYSISLTDFGKQVRARLLSSSGATDHAQ